MGKAGNFQDDNLGEFTGILLFREHISTVSNRITKILN